MKKNKKIIIWVLVIFALLLLVNQPSDKKESAGEFGKVGLGIGLLIVAGAIAFFSYGTLWAYYIPLVALAAGLLGIGGFSLFSGIAGIFTPDKGIPTWAIVTGFGVILMMVLKNKK